MEDENENENGNENANENYFAMEKWSCPTKHADGEMAVPGWKCMQKWSCPTTWKNGRARLEMYGEMVVPDRM